MNYIASMNNDNDAWVDEDAFNSQMLSDEEHIEDIPYTDLPNLETQATITSEFM